MVKKIGIASLCFLCLAFGCTHYDKSREIINSWKVTDIQMIHLDSSTSSSSGSVLVQSVVYHFRADSTYTIEYAHESDEGTWIISKDQKALLLKSGQNRGDDAEFLIESFLPYQMVLSTQIDGVKELITLKVID